MNLNLLKKLKNLTIVATVSIFSIVNVEACPLDTGHKFFPENDLFFPVGAKGTSKVTKELFFQILKKIETTFSAEIRNEGAKLKIYPEWDAGEVNAYAIRNVPGEYSVHIFGGLARHPAMTVEGIALITCHELGHHIGGAPRKSDNTWASSEGQADYWASNKCLKKIFSKDDNTKFNKATNIDTEIKKQCQNFYKDNKDYELCLRNSNTGLTLGKILNSLSHGTKQISFLTPDQNKVETSDDGHPKAQCRLDTYFAGALCNLDWSSPVSQDSHDVETGSCTGVKGNAYKTTRPRCWFAPSDFENYL